MGPAHLYEISSIEGDSCNNAPFNYVLGNPVSLIDPDGAETVYVDGVKQNTYEAGLWQDKVNREITVIPDDPAIDGLRGAFKAANQALLEFGVEQDVIDAGNAAFDKSMVRCNFKPCVAHDS